MVVRVLLSFVACGAPDTPAVDRDGAPVEDTGTLETVVDRAVLDLSSRVHPTIGSIVEVSWTQTAAGPTYVAYTFDDGVWLRSPVRELAAGPHEELLLGVPFGTEVTWRVVAEPLTSPDQLATTGPLPDTIPQGRVLVSGAYDPGSPYVLLSLGTEPYWVLIVDRQLRVVWAMESPPDTYAMHPRINGDGRSLLVDRNTFWGALDGGAGAAVVELQIDGSLVRELPTPGAHHAFTDLPDGSLAYGAAQGYDTETLEIIRPDGSTDALWDCQAWLDTIDPSRFCNSNTLSYDPDTHTFLFSFWSLETVVQIDADTGEVERWFGRLGGSYSFDPPESAFWWQHGGVLTAEGTFLTSSDLTSEGVETVVREYVIDVPARTLHEVWSFGVGEGVYGRFMGEAHRLANGNTLHNYGALARLREATPDREVVWDAEWDAGEIGRSTPFSDLYSLAPDRQ